MATRNIVPRATGEGSIGTSAKTWSAVYANDIAVTNGVSASTFTGNLTGTASGNLALSGGTLTGVVNGVTPPNGDNSKKLATTEFVTAKAGNYLPLSGGTLTGSINYVENGKVFAIENTGIGAVDLGWSYDNREGAGLELRSTDHSNPGEFILFARGANNTCYLTGMPDGSLTWNNQPLLPVGVVQAFAGSTIPTGWLLCDGSAVSRTDYAALYAVIGTTYGAGNGSTTFNLPDLVDKFVEGSATAGTVKSAGLPNITGTLSVVGNKEETNWNATTNGTGCFKNVISKSGIQSFASCEMNNHDSTYSQKFDASRSSAIYGKSDTVQPPALTMRYIIKY